MIETKKTDINGREWQCTQWAGTKNFTMLFDLTTIVAPTLAHGIRPGEGIWSSQINLGAAVDALIGQLGTSDKAQALIYRLLDGVHIDGRHLTKSEFDVAFVGPRLFDLVPGLIFVLETNFGDFSSLLSAITSLSGAREKQKAGKTLPVPKEG